MNVLTVVMLILTLVGLVLMFIELFGVVFKSMTVEDQRVWEYDHFSTKGYDKRRKQVLWQMMLMGSLVVIFFALAWWRADAFAQQKDIYYFASGRDETGESLFSSIGLAVLALAGSFRVAVLKVKLRALRIMQNEQEEKTN